MLLNEFLVEMQAGSSEDAAHMALNNARREGVPYTVIVGVKAMGGKYAGAHSRHYLAIRAGDEYPDGYKPVVTYGPDGKTIKNHEGR